MIEMRAAIAHGKPIVQSDKRTISMAARHLNLFFDLSGRRWM